MKLGAKKSKQTELLDALGPEMAASQQDSYGSQPATPAVEAAPRAAAAAPTASSERGSVPVVDQAGYVVLLPLSPRTSICIDIDLLVSSVHIVIKEQLSLSLLRDGGVQAMELKGDMNLLITDPDQTHLRLALKPASDFGGNALQFKQHPNVGKFAPGKERVVALKDSTRAFPVGQSLAVLKWRYAGTDESNVPLSSAYRVLVLSSFEVGVADH